MTDLSKIAVPFDTAKLIALAKALQAEIDAQDYAMGKVASDEVYDEAFQLYDHLSNFVASLKQDDEDFVNSPERRRRAEG